MTATIGDQPQWTVAGLTFRNPVVLAAGTAGFGQEVEDVLDLAAIGGIATKAVSVAPRHGAPPLRVSEFAGGMINAIGLANPGLDAVRAEYLPWLRRAYPDTRVIVNVVGNSVEDFETVVGGLDNVPGGGCVRTQRQLPQRESGRDGVRR